MAIVFPENWQKFVANRSEKIVVNKLLNALNDGVYILTNVLKGEENLEYDQVLITAAGILILETKGYYTVKDMKLRIREDRLKSKLFRRIANILQELRGFVEEDIVSTKGFDRIFVGAALVVPFLSLTKEDKENLKKDFGFFYDILDQNDLNDENSLYNTIIEILHTQRDAKKLRGTFKYVSKDLQESVFRALSGNLSKRVHEYVKSRLGRELLEKEQEDIVTWKAENPHEILMVYGSPGSGKTVIAIHRAFERANKENKSVLYVCFNEALKDTVKDIFDKEKNIGGLDIKAIIDISKSTVEAYLKERVEISPIPEGVIRDLSESLNLHAYRVAMELKWISGHNFKVVDEYLQNSISGIDTLDEKTYRTIFTAFEALKSQYVDNEQNWYNTTYEFLPMIALKILESKRIDGTFKKYDEIIVDEGQDFYPVSLQILLYLLNNEGELIFLYDRSQSMFVFGVDYYNFFVRMGFSPTVETLKYNYRNPKEIVELALKVFQDPILKEERKIYRENYRVISTFSLGYKPVIKGFSSQEKEIEFIGHKIKESQKMGRSIAVLTLSSWWKEKLENELAKIVNDKKVIISTMQKFKGLEFDVVILTGITEGRQSGEFSLGTISKITRSINVAITRAENKLYITYNGNPHPALKVFLD